MPAKLAIVSLFDKLDRSRGADIPPTSANTLDLENNVVFSALNSKFPHTLYICAASARGHYSSGDFRQTLDVHATVMEIRVRQHYNPYRLYIYIS